MAGEFNDVTPEMVWNVTTHYFLSKYDLRYIFNLDEFGLFYQSLLNKTMHMRGKKCWGGKHSKLRLIGLGASNVWGGGGGGGEIAIVRYKLKSLGALGTPKPFLVATDGKRTVGWVGNYSKRG